MHKYIADNDRTKDAVFVSTLTVALAELSDETQIATAVIAATKPEFRLRMN
jgi:putative Ca2+/H+ antiporter (TMEM165/GDT1 family)